MFVLERCPYKEGFGEVSLLRAIRIREPGKFVKASVMAELKMLFVILILSALVHENVLKSRKKCLNFTLKKYVFLLKKLRCLVEKWH